MIATVKIETFDELITVTQDIDFNPIELPYGLMGYKNNGSSESSEDNLSKYWIFVDRLLENKSIDANHYITLRNIEQNGMLYGLVN